jgi:phage antirepressor YoqD-like protein
MGHAENWWTVSEISKIVGIKGVGRNKFMAALREDGIVLAGNFPSQYFINMGLARMHGVVRNHTTYYIPVFSERGVNYLKNKYNKV